ncbi:hypothetical protein GCM10009624_23590 [Gordonia sinesedis]
MTDSAEPDNVDRPAVDPNDPDEVDPREALIAERDSTRALVETLAARLEAVLEATADTAADDEHDPEGATLAVERGHIVAQLERSRTRLEELDAAFQRVEEGTYGICEVCGEPIAAVRLEVLPAARMCVTCAARNPRRQW